jgi:hypothetical protein
MCGLALSLSASTALACAICLGPIPEPTLADRLATSERAVLVVSAGAGSRFRIVAVVKGAGAVGDPLSASVEQPAPSTGEALLLVQEPRGWTALGAIGVEDAPVLKRFAALGPCDDLDERALSERLAFFVGYLEDPRPLVAQAAYQELAHAPHASMRALKGSLDAAKLRRWVEDPALFSRQPLYLMLLAIGGDPTDARYFEQRIDRAQRAHIAAQAHLSALLAADLERRGDAGVSFIERTYILDRSRSGDELAASLLALSVHGNAPGRVSRERVVAAYRLLIRERKPLAAYAARDLAAWNDWGAVPDYERLLKNSTLDISSRLAIANYLRASPKGMALNGQGADASPARQVAPLPGTF